MAIAGELAVALTGDLRGLKASFSEAKQETRSLQQTLEQAGQKMTAVGEKMTMAVTGPLLAAFGGLTIGTRNFRKEISVLENNVESAGASMENIDEAMAKTKAVTDDTQASVEGLSNLLAADFKGEQMQQVLNNLNGAALKFKETIKLEEVSNALQETLGSGKAVGQFAELLERSGIQLEQFEKGLQEAKEAGEAQNYILQTLADTGLSEVYNQYLKNNEELVNSAEATYDLQESLAELGETLEPILTRVTRVTTKAVDAFNSLDKEIKDSILVGAGIAGVIGPIAVVMGQITTAVSGLIPLISGLSATFTPLLVGGAILAGLTAVVAVINRMKTAKEREIEATQRQVDANEKLVEEYERLREKENKSASEKERLREISEELAKQYPEMVTGIDEETGAYENNTKAIKENIKATNMKLRQERVNQNIADLKTEIKELESAEEDLRKTREEMEERPFQLGAQRINFELREMGLDEFVREKFTMEDILEIEDSEKFQKNLGQASEDFREKWNEAKQEVIEHNQALREKERTIEKLNKQQEKANQKLEQEKEVQSIIQNAVEGQITAEKMVTQIREARGQQVEKEKQKTKETTKDVNNLKEGYLELNDTQNKVTTSYKNIISAQEKEINSSVKVAKQLDEIINSTKESVFQNEKQKESIIQLQSPIEALNQKYSDQAKALMGVLPLSDSLKKKLNQAEKQAKAFGNEENIAAEKTKILKQAIIDKLKTHDLESTEVQNLITLYNKYKNKSKEASDETKESTNKMKSFWYDFAESIDSEIQDTFASILDESESATDKFEDIWDKAVSNVSSKIGDELTKSMDGIAGAVAGSASAGLIESVIDYGVEWYQDLFDDIEAAWLGSDTAAASWDKKYKKMRKEYNKEFSKISEFEIAVPNFSNLVDKDLQEINKKVEDGGWFHSDDYDMVKNLPKYSEAFNEKMKELTNEIMPKLKNILGDISGGLKSAFNADTYDGFLESFGKSLKSTVFNNLKQAFLESEAIKPLMKKLSGTIYDATKDGNLNQKEQKQIGKIYENISNVAGNFYKGLQQVEQGLNKQLDLEQPDPATSSGENTGGGAVERVQNVDQSKKQSNTYIFQFPNSAVDKASIKKFVRNDIKPILDDENERRG